MKIKLKQIKLQHVVYSLIILYLAILLFLIVRISMNETKFSLWTTLKYFLDKEIHFSVLLMLIFMVIPICALLLSIFGVICTFRSKQLMLKWKLLIVLLTIDIFYLAWVQSYNEKHSLIMPSYFFHDDGDWVMVKGTWNSDTKLADAAQTTQLYCRKGDGFCRETIASIRSGLLSLYETDWEIENWVPEKITFRENYSALCVSYNYFIDLKNKTVTSIRTTKNPKPAGCEYVMDEPIHMHLGDPPR